MFYHPGFVEPKICTDSLLVYLYEHEHFSLQGIRNLKIGLKKTQLMRNEPTHKHKNVLCIQYFIISSFLCPHKSCHYDKNVSEYETFCWNLHFSYEILAKFWVAFSVKYFQNSLFCFTKCLNLYDVCFSQSLSISLRLSNY